jgi:hypothetical protein
MKENIELARSREFGDIISDTFVLVRQNFVPLLKAYFVICGLFLLTDILLSSAVNMNREETTLLTPLGFTELVFNFVNYSALIVTTQTYYILYKDKRNQPPKVIEVWGYFKYYFFRVFLAQILSSIALVIGCFLCFLPLIYLSVVFSLISPIMVIENGSIEYSFKKAFRIIKGNWWFTFGIILLVTIIILMIMIVLMVPSFIIYGGSQWLTGKNLDTVASIIQAVIMNFCQVLWTVPFTATTLVYYAVTEEKEGTSLIERINRFGKKNERMDQPSSEQY